MAPLIQLHVRALYDFEFIPSTRIRDADRLAKRFTLNLQNKQSSHFFGCHWYLDGVGAHLLNIHAVIKPLALARPTYAMAIGGIRALLNIHLGNFTVIGPKVFFINIIIGFAGSTFVIMLRLNLAGNLVNLPFVGFGVCFDACLLYTSPSPRD